MSDTQEQVSLSTLLREGSRSEYEAAEGTSFVGELMAGRVNERGYADYLARLQRVYTALEAVGRALAGDPVADAVLDPALERSAAIARDVLHWGQGDADAPATDAYVARIEASQDWAGLFVAHHYTRYLGDLSGGRAIGAVVRREYDLQDEGLAFYEFERITKPKPYKDAYRSRLDALPLDAVQRAAVLVEVKRVFGLNGALLGELSADLPTYRR